MNTVEVLEGRVAALARRVEALEKTLRMVQIAGEDAAEAGRLVVDIGFEVEILHLPRHTDERRKVALKLADRGWSQARIARVMGCCERTVERWMAGNPEYGAGSEKA